MFNEFCKSRGTLMIGFFVAMILTSCGGAGLIFGNSPASTVKKYFDECNQGEYSKVEELYTTDAQKTLHGERITLMGGLRKICAVDTRDGTFASVDIKTVTVKGEGATVIADVHFKDGSTKQNDSTQLIKENSSWKITF